MHSQLDFPSSNRHDGTRGAFETMTRASTTMTKCAALLLCSSSCSLRCWAFSSSTASSHGTRPIPVASSQCLRAEETEWTSDFDDYIPASKGGADDPESSSSSSSAAPTIGSIFQSRKARDWSGVETRQFSLGEDLVLANFVGKMGFDEVTDWEYYYENEEDPDDRKVVRPNPFDESKPKRTRQSSGSVVSGREEQICARASERESDGRSRYLSLVQRIVLRCDGGEQNDDKRESRTHGVFRVLPFAPCCFVARWFAAAAAAATAA